MNGCLWVSSTFYVFDSVSRWQCIFMWAREAPCSQVAHFTRTTVARMVPGFGGGSFCLMWVLHGPNKTTPPPKNPRSTTPFHSGPVFVERGRDLARLQRIFTKKNPPLLTCCFNVATGEMRNNLGIRVSESADAVADGALFDRVQSCCFV